MELGSDLGAVKGIKGGLLLLDALGFALIDGLLLGLIIG